MRKSCPAHSQLPAPSSQTAEEKTGHRSLVIRSLVCWVLELANTCAAPKQAGAVPAFWTRSRLKIIRRGSICCVNFVIAAGCHSVAEYPCACRPLRASDAAEKVDQLGVQEHGFRGGCSSSTPVVCASKRLFLGKSRKGLASSVGVLNAGGRLPASVADSTSVCSSAIAYFRIQQTLSESRVAKKRFHSARGRSEFEQIAQQLRQARSWIPPGPASWCARSPKWPSVSVCVCVCVTHTNLLMQRTNIPSPSVVGVRRAPARPASDQTTFFEKLGVARCGRCDKEKPSNKDKLR